MVQKKSSKNISAESFNTDSTELKLSIEKSWSDLRCILKQIQLSIGSLIGFFIHLFHSFQSKMSDIIIFSFKTVLIRNNENRIAMNKGNGIATNNEN